MASHCSGNQLESHYFFFTRTYLISTVFFLYYTLVFSSYPYHDKLVSAIRHLYSRKTLPMIRTRQAPSIPLDHIFRVPSSSKPYLNTQSETPLLLPYYITLLNFDSGTYLSTSQQSICLGIYYLSALHHHQKDVSSMKEGSLSSLLSLQQPLLQSHPIHSNLTFEEFKPRFRIKQKAVTYLLMFSKMVPLSVLFHTVKKVSQSTASLT